VGVVTQRDACRRRVGRRVRVVLAARTFGAAYLAGVALLGCREPQAAGAPPEASTSRPAILTAAAVAPAGSPEPEPPEAGVGWRGLVVEERWPEAASLIDAEYGPRPHSAEMRYLRARLAAELGEEARGLELIEGLEEAVPLLADEVARLRAGFQLVRGPYEPARAYFAARSDPASLLEAARAEERLGEISQAFARVDGVVQRLARQARRNVQERATLVEAHVERVRLGEALKRRKAQLESLRWLCTEGATAPRAIGADDRLEVLGVVLTAPERLERAMQLGRDGQLERALREVSIAEKLPGQRAAELAHTRGWAHYYARRYAEAAEQLTESARLGTQFRVQDSFYAARAWSRAQQDDRAIAGYQAIVRTHPGSRFAEDARYLIAHVEYARGRFAEADAAYGVYLQHHGKQPRFKAAVDHERAVTWLALGKFGEARGALRALSRAESSERRRALLDELHAVATAGAGDVSGAEKLLRAVIEAHPLSFAALASRARLRQLGLPVPELIPPPSGDLAPPPLEVTLPPRAALLHRLGLDGDAEADIRRQAAEIMSAHAPRGGEALCVAYGKLDTAAQRYRHAQSILKASLVAQAPSAATRWAWECLYPRPFAAAVEEAERAHTLPAGLVHAVMRQESAFLHGAVSPVGAYGLMQLMEATARRLSTEMDTEFEARRLGRPGVNIRYGARYLGRLLERFGGRVELAAGGYNAGPHAMSRWLEGGEALPLDVFVARIPYAETRDYVQRVVGNLARYRLLAGGEAAVPELVLEIPRGLRAQEDDY
jgi:soluble lytic murein transglycosylase